MLLRSKMNHPDPILTIMRNITPLRLNQFNERMYLQKLGYLLQQIHHDDSYDFSWYVRGPYSSPLASALFLHDEKGTFSKPSTLSDSENKTKKLILELLGKNAEDPYTLELYASLWYLMSGRKISAKERDNILRIMCKEKPHFNRKEIYSALEKISRFRQKHSI